MQIQRLQSLFLFIAAIFTGAYCFMPYAVITDSMGQNTNILISDSPILLILNSTITILLLISIFLYKNLRLQMNITKIDIALIIGAIITTLFYTFGVTPQAYPTFQGGIIMLLFSLAFSIAALRRMRYDKKLLSSTDRLR